MGPLPPIHRLPPRLPSPRSICVVLRSSALSLSPEALCCCSRCVYPWSAGAPALPSLGVLQLTTPAELFFCLNWSQCPVAEPGWGCRCRMRASPTPPSPQCLALPLRREASAPAETFPPVISLRFALAFLSCYSPALCRAAKCEIAYPALSPARSLLCPSSAESQLCW